MEYECGSYYEDHQNASAESLLILMYIFLQVLRLLTIRFLARTFYLSTFTLCHLAPRYHNLDLPT